MTITKRLTLKEDVIGQRIGNVIVKDNDELITTLKKEEIDVVINCTKELHRKLQMNWSKLV